MNMPAMHQMLDPSIPYSGDQHTKYNRQNRVRKHRSIDVALPLRGSDDYEG